jgi:hypothetical protein
MSKKDKSKESDWRLEAKRKQNKLIRKRIKNKRRKR